MNALPLDHLDDAKKTMNAAFLFRNNLDVTQTDATKRGKAIRFMAEILTLSAVKEGCHQHTKSGGKLVARRSHEDKQSHRDALHLAAAAAAAAAAAEAEAGGGVKKRKLAASAASGRGKKRTKIASVMIEISSDDDDE